MSCDEYKEWRRVVAAALTHSHLILTSMSVNLVIVESG